MAKSLNYTSFKLTSVYLILVLAVQSNQHQLSICWVGEHMHKHTMNSPTVSVSQLYLQDIGWLGNVVECTCLRECNPKPHGSKVSFLTTWPCLAPI